jgi:hypothetical protein
LPESHVQGNAPSGKDVSLPGKSQAMACTAELSVSSISTTTASAFIGTPRHSSGGDSPSPSLV